MKDYHRIDKSRFSGRYIGYACNQVWIITRTSRQSQWIARCRDQPWLNSIPGDTLREVNEKLEAAHRLYELDRAVQRAKHHEAILKDHTDGSVH